MEQIDLLVLIESKYTYILDFAGTSLSPQSHISS